MTASTKYWIAAFALASAGVLLGGESVNEAVAGGDHLWGKFAALGSGLILATAMNCAHIARRRQH